MEILCGTDIIEIGRIEKSINEFGDSFIKRLFTDEEVAYCEGRRKARYESYAARFAAKEAVLKALDAGRDTRITWHEMEILNDASGKPRALLRGEAANRYAELDIRSITVSLSHCREYAVATVCALAGA